MLSVYWVDSLFRRGIWFTYYIWLFTWFSTHGDDEYSCAWAVQPTASAQRMIDAWRPHVKQDTKFSIHHEIRVTRHKMQTECAFLPRFRKKTKGQNPSLRFKMLRGHLERYRRLAKSQNDIIGCPRWRFAIEIAQALLEKDELVPGIRVFELHQIHTTECKVYLWPNFRDVGRM